MAAHPGPTGERSLLRSVAVPGEHGGWGLTLEPALLGLLVAPTGAGACLAGAALLAFLARTPFKLALVDVARHRRLPRTGVAARVAAVELVALGTLVITAAVLADGPFWVPALVAVPLVALELWFDVRSRSRRLAPELAGAVGIAAVAAMIVLADDGDPRLAAGLWLVLAARALTSIPFVRVQIARLHGRPSRPVTLVVTDLAALVVAGAAVALDAGLVAGAGAVLAVVAFQRVTARGPVPRAGVLGARQVVLGLVVVFVTALGALAP